MPSDSVLNNEHLPHIMPTNAPVRSVCVHIHPHHFLQPTDLTVIATI